TGTPTFLIKLLQETNSYIPTLENLKVSAGLLDSFDIENIRIEPVLFQAGYLTIDKIIELEFGGFEYHLKLPNKEVALSFNDMLIVYLTDEHQFTQTKSSLFTALKNGDMNLFKNTLATLFASIPYNNYVNNTISSYEGYFASVIYAYLASLGLNITAEDVTSKGRIDLTIKLGDNIYILEFKVDGNGTALQQIKEKNYQQKYLADEKDIYLIGIDFNSNEKNIARFEWERAN
ncbi:MAG: PD-(D/E)XK nuclease domain-containing protein, partial [Thermodesulfobacteriota bacterium]|nr:PD-(D/E)XK nuclease domain-containing protein [Thermodesulfobacteriota bacterium]